MVLLAALLLVGCTVGPDYRRPQVAVPPDFRGLATDTPGGAESLGDIAWWKIFQDETLQSLIRTALAENYDLRIAAARILEARAQVTIVRSAQFPDVSASASAPYVSLPGDRAPLQSRETFSPLGTFDLVWELDLWGRLRRATEAARAQLLASEDVQRFVVTTLVSDVATAYFQLRELDLELEISRRTLTTRQEAVRLVTLRYQGGVAALIDLRQAEVLLYTAAATIPDVMRRIEQTENLISVLLGRNPAAVPLGRPLLQQFSGPIVPRRLGCTRRAPEAEGSPHRAAVARQLPDRRGAAGQRSLSRRRHELSRGARHRAPALRRRAAAGPVRARRAARRRAALPGARRWLDGVVAVSPPRASHRWGRRSRGCPPSSRCHPG